MALRGLLDAFVGVCNAVAFAHSRGVIHRDLKPHNVVLGDFGEVIVLDWGLAKLMDQPEAEALPVTADGDADGTQLGQVLGTPAYMAPEQADPALDVDTRADVYALGVLLYELLAGSPPFEPERLRRAACRPRGSAAALVGRGSRAPGSRSFPS